MPLNLLTCQTESQTESQRLSSLVLFHEFRPYILHVYICVLACYRCIDVRTIKAYHVSCDMWQWHTLVIGGVRLARLAFKVHMRAVQQKTG
jgi:hypothetical protein